MDAKQTVRVLAVVTLLRPPPPNSEKYALNVQIKAKVGNQ